MAKMFTITLSADQLGIWEYCDHEEYDCKLWPAKLSSFLGQLQIPFDSQILDESAKVIVREVSFAMSSLLRGVFPSLAFKPLGLCEEIFESEISKEYIKFYFKSSLTGKNIFSSWCGCYFISLPPNDKFVYQFKPRHPQPAYIFTPDKMFYFDGEKIEEIKIDDPEKLVQLKQVLKITPDDRDRSPEVLSLEQLRSIKSSFGHVCTNTQTNDCVGSYGIEVVVEFDTHSISNANPPKVTVKIELPESVTIPEHKDIKRVKGGAVDSLATPMETPIKKDMLAELNRLDLAFYKPKATDFIFTISGTEELDRLTTCFTGLEGSSSAAFNGALKYYKADDDSLILELANGDFVDKGKSSGYLAFFGIPINRKIKKDELRFLRDIFPGGDYSILLKDIFPEKPSEVVWEDFLSSEITLETFLYKIAGKIDSENVEDPYRKVLCGFKFALVKRELKAKGFSDEAANFIIISSIQNSGQQGISSLLFSSYPQIVSGILFSIFEPIGLSSKLLGADMAISSVRRDKNGCMTFSALVPGQITKLNGEEYSYRLMLNATEVLKKRELGFYVTENKVIAKLQGKDDFPIPESDEIFKLIMEVNKREGAKGFTAKEKKLLSQNPLLLSYTQKISDFYVKMNITFPSSPSPVPEITFSVTLPEAVSGIAVKGMLEEKLVTVLDTRLLHEETTEILISRLRLQKDAELGIEGRQADAVSGNKKSALLRLISGYIGILQVVPGGEQKLADMRKLQGVLVDEEEKEAIPRYFKHAFSKILGTESKANTDAIFSLSFAANHDASDHRKKYSSADVMDAVQGAVLYDLSAEGRTDNTFELLCDGHLMKKLVEDSSDKNIEKLAGILLDYRAQANITKQKLEQKLEKERDGASVAKLEHAKEALKNAERTLERFFSTRWRPFGINFGKRIKNNQRIILAKAEKEAKALLAKAEEVRRIFFRSFEFYDLCLMTEEFHPEVGQIGVCVKQGKLEYRGMSYKEELVSGAIESRALFGSLEKESHHELQKLLFQNEVKLVEPLTAEHFKQLTIHSLSTFLNITPKIGAPNIDYGTEIPRLKKVFDAIALINKVTAILSGNCSVKNDVVLKQLIKKITSGVEFFEKLRKHKMPEAEVTKLSLETIADILSLKGRVDGFTFYDLIGKFREVIEDAKETIETVVKEQTKVKPQPDIVLPVTANAPVVDASDKQAIKVDIGSPLSPVIAYLKADAPRDSVISPVGTSEEENILRRTKIRLSGGASTYTKLFNFLGIGKQDKKQIADKGQREQYVVCVPVSQEPNEHKQQSILQIQYTS